MASKQIKGLTAATDIAATDVLILQGTTGDAKKITGTNVGGALESGGGVALSLAAAQVAAAGSDSQVQYSNSGVTAGDADLVWNDSTKVLQIGASTATAQLKLPISNDAVTPTLAFGDGDTGLYESADDTLTFAIAGSASFSVASTGLTAANANGPAMLNEAASATNPTLAPDRSDADTGIGTGTADTLSLVAGGVEMVRCVESTTDSVCIRADNTAVTDADIPASFVAFYLDEGNNKIHFRVRYSDDTLKIGELLLT
jgi:hypothetical protein